MARYVVAIGCPADGRFQSSQRIELGQWDALWRAKRKADEVAADPDCWLPQRHGRVVHVFDLHNGGSVYNPLREAE